MLSRCKLLKAFDRFNLTSIESGFMLPKNRLIACIAASQPGMLILVLVLVLKDSLRTFFKSLSLSWSLGVRSLSLSLSLGVRVQEVLVLVLVLGVRSLSLSWSLWSSPCPCL